MKTHPALQGASSYTHISEFWSGLGKRSLEVHFSFKCSFFYLIIQTVPEVPLCGTHVEGRGDLRRSPSFHTGTCQLLSLCVVNYEPSKCLSRFKCGDKWGKNTRG